MNALHLVATLASTPTDSMIQGERYFVAEVFVRPPSEEAPPLLPDRLRLVTRAGSTSGTHFAATAQGDVIAVSGSIRRSPDSRDWEVLLTQVEKLGRV